MKQSSLFNFFKKHCIDEQPVMTVMPLRHPPPLSATLALDSHSITGISAPAETPLAAVPSANSPTPMPGFPETKTEKDAKIYDVNDLSAVDKPACQPKMGTFPVTPTANGKNRNFSAN